MFRLFRYIPVTKQIRKDSSTIPKYITGLSQDGTIPDGKYPFEIVAARMRTAKSGAEMIEVTLEAGHNGNSVKVLDWLVFDGRPFTSGRIDQIRTSVGELILPGEEVDVQPGDLLHKTGMVHLVIEEWQNRKRNKVGSYLEPEEEIPGLELQPRPKASKSVSPKSELI